MADSDSLPLQGPPQPAPTMRAYAEPPSTAQPGYADRSFTSSAETSPVASGGLPPVPESSPPKASDSRSAWLSIPVGVIDSASPAGPPAGPLPPPPLPPSPSTVNLGAAPPPPAELPPRGTATSAGHNFAGNRVQRCG